MPRRARPDDGVLAAWRGFLGAHRAIVDELDRDLVERHGMPLAWYDVLVQLNEAGGELTMGELASRLLISPSTCTRVVERMVADALVERRVDERDARVRHVSLTPVGRTRFRAAALTHLAGIQRHFGRFLTGDEAERWTAAFRAMQEAAGSAAD